MPFYGCPYAVLQTSCQTKGVCQIGRLLSFVALLPFHVGIEAATAGVLFKIKSASDVPEEGVA